ncbi:MAG: dihydrolipoyl dehydrogenase [Thermoplasmata archaeon]
MGKRLIVIGSGPGGYKSAVLGAEEDLDVTLVEKDVIGGVCTNTGCIPSKALLSGAELVDSIKGAKRKGIKVELKEVDFSKLQKIKDRAVTVSRKGVERELKEKGVEIIEGEASITGEDEVRVGERTLSADNIIIATGSEPIAPPFLDVDEKNVLTNQGAFALRESPESMLIIGGGYIGVEMAFIYSSMGTSVTMVELMENLLPNMDRDLGKEAEKILKRKRVKVVTETKVTSVDGNGPFTAVVDGKKSDELEVEKILCAVGRRPTPPEMDLDIIDENGSIVTDGLMRTPVENIYAVGDVTGKGMFAHTAYHQAKIAIDVIAGRDAEEFSRYPVPAGVFTHPEIASVGLSEEGAKKEYEDVRTASYPISALGRGYSTGERTGFAKIVCSGDKVVGLHLICPGAMDIIMEGTVVLQKGITYREIIDIIHPHPTYSEAIYKAAKLLAL